MSIQISVVIWTVLCFIAFIFLVSRFLFAPLLSVMDARNKKIDDARALREEADARYEAQKSDYEERKAEEMKSAAVQGEAEIAAAKESGNEALKSARADYENQIEQLRSQLETESQAIEQQLDGEVDTLALAYATALVS